MEKNNKKIVLNIYKITEILDKKVNWCLGSSCSLLVHGLDVYPNDIDIIVDNSDYDKACDILKEFIITETEIYESTKKTHFKIDSIKGEILMFPINCDDLEYRKFMKCKVPVNKLEIEYGFYKAREDKKEANALKIKMIEAEIEKRKK